MHILFLINSLTKTCGISSHVHNLLCGLKEYGSINISIICGHADEDWIMKLQALHIKLISNNFFDHNKRNYCRFTGAVLYLSFYCLSHKVDIIHSHHHYCANIAYHISKCLKIKTFLTNHGIIPSVGRLYHYKADTLIVPTLRIKNHIVTNEMITESKVFVINNGVVRTKGCIPEGLKLKIISGSRMIKLKSLDIYIKAVALLGKEYLDKAEFYLAGDGPDKNYLLELITNSQIQYIGNVLDFRTELCKYNIYIHPSTLEAFPMSLLEAGISKTLVIASNFEGLNEFFAKNIDGLVFEKNNVSDLCDKMMYAVDHYNDLKCMINSYHDKVCQYYTYERMSEQILNLYRE